MSVGEMQFIQAIPFVCVFAFFLLNLAIKRKFFCISSLALLYVSLAMLGAVFLVEKPRTGFPYVRLDAMIFLSVCFSLLCLPALFFKDGKKNEKMPFVDLPDNVVRFVTWALCILTVPASIFYLFRSMPLFITYLSSGISRGEFRDSLPDFGGGLSSIENMLVTFGASFSMLALFWAIYCVALKKQKARNITLLFFGALGPCIDSIKTVSRQTLFIYLLFGFVVLMLFFRVIQETHKKRIKQFALLAALVLLLPFIAISAARFKDNLVYSLASYFATGPYSFNADYAARTEYGVKPLNGYMTFGWHLLIAEKITDKPVYQNARDALENFAWGGDQQRGTNPETFLIYRQISGAYSFEFKSAAGSVLLDYPPWGVLLFFSLFSCFFTWIFLKSKEWTIPLLLLAAPYFYILFFSPIGWGGVQKQNAFILFLIFVYGIYLYIKNKQAMRFKPPLNPHSVENNSLFVENMKK